MWELNFNALSNQNQNPGDRDESLLSRSESFNSLTNSKIAFPFSHKSDNLDQHQRELFTIFRVFHFHDDVIVDLVWQSGKRPDVLLSLSLDKTIRVWNIKDELINVNGGVNKFRTIKDSQIATKILRHDNMISCMDINPTYPDILAVGYCQGTSKIRLWNLGKDRLDSPMKIGMDTDLSRDVTKEIHIITTLSFSPDGKLLIVGMSDGLIMIMEFAQDNNRVTKTPIYTLKNNNLSQVACRNRDGKLRDGRKVTGIAFLKSHDSEYEEEMSRSALGLSPGEIAVLVSTNDNRIRLISFTISAADTTYFRQICKFKGQYKNGDMMIKASFSQDSQSRFVVSGSDNGYLCLWERDPKQGIFNCDAFFRGMFEERNSNVERIFCTQDKYTPVLCSSFAPKGTLIQVSIFAR